MSDVFSEMIGIFRGMKDAITEGVEEAKSEKARRNVELDYKPRLLPNFSYPPQSFYAQVLEHLQAQQVPGLKSAAVQMRQSGLFSNWRLYLQLRRERLVFEVCSFPFGTNCFISYRLFDRRREARWYHYLLLLVVLGLLGLPVWAQFGWVMAVVALSGVFCLFWSIMRMSAMEDTFGHLSDMLCNAPLLGPLYETFFFPQTYYRIDTNNAYREAVRNAFNEVVDNIQSEKGRKALSTEDHAPVMKDLRDR